MSYLYQRKGIWYVRFKRDGRVLWRTLHTRSRREAERLRRDIDKLQSPFYKNPEPADNLESLRSAFEDWGTILAETTQAFYRMNLDAFLAVLKAEALDEITIDRIEAAKRTLALTKAPRTVNNILKTMRVFVNRCIRQGWHEGPNLFARVEYLRVPEHRPRWLTDKQVVSLLAVAENHGQNIYFFCALGLFAGLRKAEIDAARWEWFDWKQSLLHVRQDQGFVTKSRRERTIPFSSDLRSVLERHRKPAGYLIAPENARGDYRYRHDIRKAFSAVVKAAGVPWCTPHTLRHTFASRLVSAGVSLYKVSQWLGHADFSTTQIYAHLTPQDREIDRALLYTSVKESKHNVKAHEGNRRIRNSKHRVGRTERSGPQTRERE